MNNLNNNNNNSTIFNANDVFELLLLGTLYLFKTSLENSFERQYSHLAQFQASSIFTPESLILAEKALIKKSPIIVEGIVDSEKPIYYKIKDFSLISNKVFSLVSLYKIKAPIYFSIFDLSSQDYYKEANKKPELSRNGNNPPKIRKNQVFWLKDYQNPRIKAYIHNNPLDDKLSLDFLSLKKKYEKLTFNRFFRLEEYGKISKVLGVKSGVFMGVYGEFIEEKGVYSCYKPIKFFRSRKLVIEKMNEELRGPKLIKEVVSLAWYAGIGVWGFKKGWELARLYMNN